MDNHIPGLLDQTPVQGPVALDRYLSPTRSALIVRQDSYSDATTAIAEACTLWGGASTLLIPAPNGGPISSTWQNFLIDNGVDITATRAVVPEELLSSGAGTVTISAKGELMIAVLARKDDTGQWPRIFDTATVSEEDPWHLAYSACLGGLPLPPTPEELHLERLKDISVQDLVGVDVTPPSESGCEDLLRRTRGNPSLSPVAATLSDWAIHLPPQGSTFFSLPSMPVKHGEATRFNHNILVIYTPKNVEDLCLAWNLRSIYGQPGHAPFAIPVTADIPAVVAQLKAGHAFSATGLRSLEVAVVSASLSIDRLEAIAAQCGDGFSAIPTESVLRAGVPLSRHSSEVVVFEQGQAQAPVWSQQDRRDISSLAGPLVAAGFTVRFAMRNHPIPPIKSFSGRGVLSDRVAHGALYARNSAPSDVAKLAWPDGWLTLSAACHDRGLSASPSTPGHVAAELIHRVGDWEGLLPFLHPDILDLLQQLAQRSGMSWFKNRLNGVLREVSLAEDQAAELERQIHGLSIGAKSDEELQHVTLDAFQKALGKSRRAAEAWLRWAEKSQLLLRGVLMKCDACRRESWLPLREMAPPVTCRRCARIVERPYGPRDVVFRYRASEHLLSVLELDSMSHLLAGRFLLQIFDAKFGPGYVYGLYPGVTLKHSSTGRELEADVLALLQDGSLVPGECKRTAVGLKQQDLDNLDELCDMLDAPWSFIATLDPAENCGPLWRNAERRLGRPRFVLTREQLLSLSPTWLLNADPLRFGGDEGLNFLGSVPEFMAEQGEDFVDFRPTFQYRPSS
ncbi:hypothetical protein [Micromonospora siamensis]|uniref:Uncharacterized protein n=1 Tax=Micromonospora siamensis TaxID=299152 RepID=A0A1C5I5N9_9ACTN|nr:hypothetical protein [Micromonospora siamensis]SCG53722.1 hypothetical protein GA0074704_2973 [Micromonospora siamensis]